MAGERGRHLRCRQEEKLVYGSRFTVHGSRFTVYGPQFLRFRSQGFIPEGKKRPRGYVEGAVHRSETRDTHLSLITQHNRRKLRLSAGRDVGQNPKRS
ncbi:hypothetical protein T484DRAFT_1935399 [Baffinella frigidus]|nr:hypothetical protein T484DRAFT_1935399 [Cryptophyta sp. CCMP2293]